MDLKPVLIEMLQKAYLEIESLYNSLDEKQRSEAGTAEAWSAKDDIAHLAAWTEHLADRIAGAPEEHPARSQEEVNRVNQELFEAYHDLQWPEVMAFVHRAFDKLSERVHELSEAELRAAELFTWLEGRPIWERVVGNVSTHVVSHLAIRYQRLGKQTEADRLQEEAAAALAGLDESPRWKGTIQYNLACHYALSGNKQKAMETLKSAFELRPDLKEWSREDTDLESLHADPAFLALLI